MKRSIVSLITALSVLLAVMTLAGCDLLFPNEDEAVFAKNLWGEWLRMDKEETWYISSSAIKINDQSSSRSVSLSKQSNSVIEVSEGGGKYYLYASRTANTSFTGRIAGFDAPSSGRALGGIGGIGITIANLNDKANTVSAATGADGKFTAEGIIPGDEYQITPEGGTPVTVTPKGDGDDIGTITI
jgi:hypothetical protein